MRLGLYEMLDKAVMRNAIGCDTVCRRVHWIEQVDQTNMALTWMFAYKGNIVTT